MIQLKMTDIYDLLVTVACGSSDPFGDIFPWLQESKVQDILDELNRILLQKQVDDDNASLRRIK